MTARSSHAPPASGLFVNVDKKRGGERDDQKTKKTKNVTEREGERDREREREL